MEEEDEYGKHLNLICFSNSLISQDASYFSLIFLVNVLCCWNTSLGMGGCAGTLNGRRLQCTSQDGLGSSIMTDGKKPPEPHIKGLFFMHSSL